MSEDQDNPRRDNIKNQGKRTPPRITENYLRNAGLHYLERFAASTFRFRRVMERKIARSCSAHPDQNREQCSKLLESLIARLTQEDLLNDKAYARGSVVSLRRRGLSAQAIRARLSARGISGEAAVLALEDCGEDDLIAALRLAKKRHAGPFAGGTKSSGDDASKTLSRHLAAFARAGFSYDLSMRVMNMETDDAAAILEAGRHPSS